MCLFVGPKWNRFPLNQRWMTKLNTYTCR